MPRGEENQEPIQEETRASREVSALDEVKEQEARRDQEVVAEPESVIERERPIEESEAIEAAVVEAVKAITEVQEEEKEEEKEDEEVTAVVEAVDTAPEARETEVRQDSGREAGAGERSEILDETSFKVESPVEEAEIMDEISATPITLPRDPLSPAWEEEPPKPPQERMENGGEKEDLEETAFKVESQAEIDEEILDAASFKFYPPAPDQELSDRSAQEQISGEGVHPEETGEILKGDAFKPVPAREGTEEVEHTDDRSEPVPEGEVGEDQAEEGGSILIGEEEELEQIDTTAEAVKEVEEYWEPPEMYVYQDKDGTINFVDNQGNLIDSPPLFKKDSESDSVQAWYPTYYGENYQVFDVPPFPGHDPSELFAHIAQDGSVSLVDLNGNPVPSPPDFMRDADGSVITKDAQGNYLTIKEYQSQPDGIFIYHNPDGSVSLVNRDGDLIQSPPNIVQDSVTKEWSIKTSSGEFIDIPDYQSPIKDIYAYTAQDGTIKIVDKYGNLVKCPPAWYSQQGKTGGSDTNLYVKGDEEGEYQIIPSYTPSTEGVYAHTGQDGTITLVNEKGQPIECPPHMEFDQTSKTMVIEGKDGSMINLPEFHYDGVFLYANVFVHTAQDGTFSAVDANGKLVDSPPIIEKVVDNLGNIDYFTKVPNEDGFYYSVALKKYKPPSAH